MVLFSDREGGNSHRGKEKTFNKHIKFQTFEVLPLSCGFKA